ncbi:hypothetical protein [Planctomicrobium piriforme]|uniref:Uncharacterized protein n=1 Tax=Planctomicrobium piriforme TaxID=1576369 RepID=A0A1I3RBY9_9PLAN|nr:hypothetical protein [Planctomicrobium piriforme]SFJ42847.1 hypothetical protein SAMN05421753_12051 [Planctomicrobium piriforme]
MSNNAESNEGISESLKLSWALIEPLLELPTDAIGEEFRQLYAGLDRSVQRRIMKRIGDQLEDLQVRKARLENLLSIILGQ